MIVQPSMLPAQRALVHDRTSTLAALIGGYRSGKTSAAAMKALALGFENAPTYGLVVAPTYVMARDVVLRTFTAFLQQTGIPYRLQKQEHTITVAPGYPQQFDILIRSGDNADRLLGLTAGWAIIDEPGMQDEAIAQQVVTRVSDRRAKVPQTVLTGTPEGVNNWLYDWLIAKPKEGTRLHRAKTTDNAKNLPERYIENMLARYDPEEVEAYINGEFVVLEGGVYRHFKRAKHARPCTNPLDGQLVVGADFNVAAPEGSNLGMCWVIGRIVGDELHVFHEIVKNNTNTYEQADELVAYLQGLLAREGGRADAREAAAAAMVYCDASGDHRRSSAARSDVAILRQAGFKVFAPSKNPPVRDRVNTVDHRFRIDRCLIDPHGCPNLVRALEQQALDKNGDPEKKSGLDNVNDALGYLVWGQVGWRTTILRANEIAHPHSFTGARNGSRW